MMNLPKLCRAAWSLAALAAPLYAQPGRASRLPDAPGREVYTKVCATCHSGEIVAGRGMFIDSPMAAF